MARFNKASIKVVNNKKGSGPLGFTLFAAWTGAVVYFVQHSTGFWGFVLAVLKSFVWPAFLVHSGFKNLHV